MPSSVRRPQRAVAPRPAFCAFAPRSRPSLRAPAVRAASLAKKAEEPPEAEAATQSATHSEAIVAELRSLRNEVVAELCNLRGAVDQARAEARQEARMARLQRAYATLLANEGRYTTHFRILKRCIADALADGGVCEIYHTPTNWNDGASHDARDFLCEIRCLTGLDWEVFIYKEKDGRWHVKLK